MRERNLRLKKRCYFLFQVIRDLEFVGFGNSSLPGSTKPRTFFEILILIVIKEPIFDRYLFTVPIYIEKLNSGLQCQKLKCVCLKDRQTHTVKNNYSQEQKRKISSVKL